MLTAEKKRVSAADRDEYLDEDESLYFPIAVECEWEYSEEEFQEKLRNLPESDIDYPEEFLKKLDEETEEAKAHIAAGEVIHMTAVEFDKVMRMPKAERKIELARRWKARGK